jgi:hypothetical protein
MLIVKCVRRRVEVYLIIYYNVIYSFTYRRGTYVVSIGKEKDASHSEKKKDAREANERLVLTQQEAKTYNTWFGCWRPRKRFNFFPRDVHVSMRMRAQRKKLRRRECIHPNIHRAKTLLLCPPARERKKKECDRSSEAWQPRARKLRRREKKNAKSNFRLTSF